MRSGRLYPKAAITFDAPFYIACEGAGDAAFIDELLKHQGVADASFHVGEAEGYTGFQRHFEGIQASTDRPKLLRLAVVADNDEDPPGRFANVKEALIAAEFPAPVQPYTIAQGPPVVGVFMVPGPNLRGNLETLLSDATVAMHPHMGPCLNQFVQCVNAPGNWTVNKRSKMQVNAVIAAYCVDDPGCSLAYIWNKASNPIPIGSNRFDELVTFLGQVENS